MEKLIADYKKGKRDFDYKFLRDAYASRGVEGHLKHDYYFDRNDLYFTVDVEREQDDVYLKHVREIAENNGFTDADLKMIKMQIEYEKKH